MDKQSVAVTLAFLMQGFNYIAKDEEEILDGIGEDCFFYECYPIAEAIVELNEAVSKERFCAGVYMFEAIEDHAAQVLFDYVKAFSTVPPVTIFIQRFKPKLLDWYKYDE